MKSQNEGLGYKPKEFVCGAGAAFVNISVTYPINKIMFRQQLNGINARKAIMQLHSEGVKSLYRGIFLPLLQKTTSSAIMFGMYDHYSKHLNQNTNWSLTHQRLCAAFMAGCIEAILCPFERTQVLMQDKYYHAHFKNTFEAVSQIRSHGTPEYYRGLSCVLLRNGPSNCAFFLLRKPIKDALPATNSHFANIFKDFLSGAVLGASISTVFYPLNVIKTRMQSRLGGNFHGIYYTFTKIYNERNRSIRKMFRGVHMNFSRSLMSWGIINASYEILWKWINGSI